MGMLDELLSDLLISVAFAERGSQMHSLSNKPGQC
jgi:hypothetical protein